MTSLFDKTLSRWIVYICLPLLFLPKINLLSFEGRETAGVRGDDLILFGLFILLLAAQWIRSYPLNRFERNLFALTAFAFISYLLNRVFVAEGWLHVNSVFVYAARLLEYFTFFYIGIECARIFSLDAIVRAFFLWNAVWMVLQKLGILGEFGPSGYVANASWRCCGIGSFASETGLLLNLLFCYFLYSDDDKPSESWVRLFPPVCRSWIRNCYPYLLFVVFGALILINGSRMALIALVVTFACKLRYMLSFRSPTTWAFMSVAVVFVSSLLSGIIQNIDALAARSTGLFSMDNIHLIERVWDSISLDYDPIGNESVAYEGNVDMSWWIRIHKWCYAFKMYVVHPANWLQGIGPGFAMAGLDGGWLRIFVEYGLIGSYLFYRLFRAIWLQSRQMKWVMVAFSINMVFFDAYLAYKPMSLLFLLSGYCFAQERCSQARSPKLSCSPLERKSFSVSSSSS